MGQPRGNFFMFDAKSAEMILLSIRAGSFAEVAAAAAGVRRETMLKWLRRGRRCARRRERALEMNAMEASGAVLDSDDRRVAEDKLDALETSLADFSDRYAQALAKAEVTAVSGITAAGAKDWRAWAWRLERQFSERWGRREKIEHTGAGGAPLVPAAATLYLPPNGRDIDAAGAPAKATTKQPPAVVDPPPPASPEVEAAAEAAGDPETDADAQELGGGHDPDPE